MTKFLKLYMRKKIIIIIAFQDKLSLTQFSLYMKFYQELRIFVFVGVYCLDVACSQTLQVQWLPPQHSNIPTC